MCINNLFLFLLYLRNYLLWIYFPLSYYFLTLVLLINQIISVVTNMSHESTGRQYSV